MEGETMRVQFEPWFVQYKVDIVFAGHVHSYERSVSQPSPVFFSFLVMGLVNSGLRLIFNESKYISDRKEYQTWRTTLQMGRVIQ